MSPTPNPDTLQHHPRVFANTLFVYDARFRVVCNCGWREGFKTSEAAHIAKENHQALYPLTVSEEIFEQRLAALQRLLTNLDLDQLQVFADQVQDQITTLIEEE